jgi:uncharacterized damage-inducible protein DinB
VDASEARLLIDYIYWMRDRILMSVEQLPAHEFLSARAVTARDLRATLVHELDVEWSWRERLRTGDFPDADDLNPDDYLSASVLRNHWLRDEREMRTWADSLADEALSVKPAGEEAPLALSSYVMHLVSHAMQQFSDAATLLSLAGHSPGELGFLEFMEQRLHAANEDEALGE